MRRIVIVTALITTLLSAPAFAQDVSAGGAFKSAYVLDDAIVATDGPVVQGWASVSISNECAADVWGSKSLDTNVGDEVDLGLSCRFSLDDETQLTVKAHRYFLLGGVPDMMALAATIAHGPVDVTVSQYIWEGGLDDATQLQMGYNTDIAPRLSGRAELTYETGFGLNDTIIVGGDIIYSLDDNFSIFATGYLPLKESGINGERVVVGVNFNF